MKTKATKTKHRNNYSLQSLNTSENFSYLRELTSAKRTIKVEIRTWNALRNLKGSNETFNDVILSLLKERTVSMGNESVGAIKYSRKTIFLETRYDYTLIGVEFDYNDIKGEQSNFNLDLKLKKVFYGKKIMNASEFFGVDSQRMHLHKVYLNIYLKCVALALEKEFRVMTRMHHDKDFENIARWKKIYYDYSLSEDSFINDIEEPLRLSEEKHTGSITNSIKKSISNSIWKIIK